MSGPRLLERGVIYKRGHQLFIAISGVALMGKGRKIHVVDEVKATFYSASRKSTVEDVYTAWGVSQTIMDVHLGPYFKPIKKKKRL